MNVNQGLKIQLDFQCFIIQKSVVFEYVKSQLTDFQSK